MITQTLVDAVVLAIRHVGMLECTLIQENYNSCQYIYVTYIMFH